MKITATIEKNENGYYQISSDDELMGCCFGGYGYSVEEAKADFMKSIDESCELIRERGEELPPEAYGIEVEYVYDLPSFFNCFDWINATQFARRAGVNESQMRQYKSGHSSASEATMQKILAAVRTLGAELSAAKL